MNDDKIVKEDREIKGKNGVAVLVGLIASIAVIIGIIVYGAINQIIFLIPAGVVAILIVILMLPGLKVVNPKEALVLVLFGNYYGTLKEEGFHWVNPFTVSFNPTVKSMQVDTVNAGVQATLGESKKVSLKMCTLNNEKQKVNDLLGNPIEIASVVIWQVEDAAKAVFHVDNYKTYISTQCDSVMRNVARCYPYDTVETEDELSLRGSSQEVAQVMKEQLQEKVELAGVKIIDVRITHLSYAPEIASAMLQRQQATAIIDARQKIVEGAVGMVEMALARLSEKNVVALDEERKAAMVSNLLVVLCANKETQPIVNSGSIY